MLEKPWFKKYDACVDPYPTFLETPLKDQFLEKVFKHPDRPFVYCHDAIYSYQDIHLQAARLANGMTAAGLKKRERVAISLSNSTEFIIIFLACLKAGAIAVLTNPRYTAHELTELFKDCGVKIVFCQAQDQGKYWEVLRSGKTSLKYIAVVRPCGELLPSTRYGKVCDYCSFIMQGSESEPEHKAHLDEIVLLIYTGGTTGVSKGCCITNRNLIAIASGWTQMMQSFTDVSNYKVLSSTPMYHVHGFQTAINANILLGGSVIVLPEITVDDILGAINKHKPNVWPSVPRQILALLSHPELRQSNARYIQHIGCGSSPLSVKTMECFEQAVGAPIIEGYGASETSMAVASNPYHFRKPGSVGIPYPGVDCKVVDIEDYAKVLASGEVGELCFKGPQIIKGYWNSSEETDLTFRDGWWFSGDIGFMDRDGYIFIVDRKKDMINCSGFKVFSSEVDAVLSKHPKIREAGVIGIPDPIRGETVKAFICLEHHEELTEKDVKMFCRQYLAAYKIPTHIDFVDELPHTAIQKLDRKKLRSISKSNKSSNSSDAGLFRPCRGFC